MIVYKKRKIEFLDDVDSGEIGEIVSRVVSLRLGIRVGPVGGRHLLRRRAQESQDEQRKGGAVEKEQRNA